MILFVHVPRTSGKLVELKIMPKKLRKLHKFHKKVKSLHGSGEKYPTKGYDAIIGAYAYGIHKYLDAKKFSYFTFLRDPTSRFISAFNRDITFPTIILPIWKDCDKNIVRFLERCIEEDRNTNVFVKQISGLESPDNIVKDHRTHLYSWSARKNKYSDAEMENMLEVAKDNLVNKFDFVGFTGNKKSYKNLAKFYKWKYADWPKFNTSKPTMNIDWKDKKISRILSEIHKYDIRLYNFAREAR